MTATVHPPRPRPSGDGLSTCFHLNISFLCAIEILELFCQCIGPWSRDVPLSAVRLNYFCRPFFSRPFFVTVYLPIVTSSPMHRSCQSSSLTRLLAYTMFPITQAARFTLQILHRFSPFFSLATLSLMNITAQKNLES